MAELFNIDFETGDLSQFDSTTDNLVTFDASTVAAQTGTYGMRCIGAGNGYGDIVFQALLDRLDDHRPWRIGLRAGYAHAFGFEMEATGQDPYYVYRRWHDPRIKCNITFMDFHVSYITMQWGEGWEGFSWR